MFNYIMRASHRSKYYKRYPFNKHIVLLYDCIEANEMNCSDFEYTQGVNYTFCSGEKEVSS